MVCSNEYEPNATNACFGRELCVIATPDTSSVGNSNRADADTVSSRHSMGRLSRMLVA